MRPAAMRPAAMRRFLPLAPLLCLALALPTAGQDGAAPPDGPAETAPEEVLQPVGILNFAGVDRAMSDVGFLFDTVDRGDMLEVVDGYLEFVNGLQGVDRGKPFGVMVFLKPGFVPIPTPVLYLPIEDLSELQKSLSFGENFTIEPVEDGLYQIRAAGAILFLKLVGGYGLVTNERAFLEERTLADPLSIAGPLSTRYDLAVQALPRNIPPGMRTLFQNLLRQNTQTQMQQRDEEPEAAFRLRKSQAKRNLESLEALLTGSEEITFGIDASAERRTIEMDFTFEAVPGTAWAEELAAVRPAPPPSMDCTRRPPRSASSPD